MELSELRKGSIVESKLHNLPYAVVEGYTPSGIVFLRSVSTYDWINDLTPVLLTDDFLLKCGFEKHGMAYLNFSFIVNKWTNGELMYGYIGGNIELKTVHQLQNLYFALTNRELNIQP